jgi:3-phenylpropionate/trans-cinnamate dioxygenase ferredoxin reductase component
MTRVDPNGHICVVGGSLAAVTAASAARASGHRGRITLISDEEAPPYARPPLSKAVLSGTHSPGSICLPSSRGVDVVLGKAAVALDLAARELTLADGSTVEFDGLVIATGASARRVDDGFGDVWTLRSVRDANRLREALRAAATMLVVGGGPLAMEIASVAAGFGLAVTVVASALPLQSYVGTHLANLLLSRAEDAGVKIVITPGGARLSRTADGRTVVLAEGLEPTAADVVCAAVGCTPNVEWLAGTGLEVSEQGLVVDEYLCTAAAVVGAGDVVAMRCPTGGVHRAPLWSNAIDQATVAAANLLQGSLQRFRIRPSFWTELFGHRLRVVGTVRDEAELTIEPRQAGFVYRWLSPQGTVEAAAALDVAMSIRRLHSLVASPAKSCGCYA